MGKFTIFTGKDAQFYFNLKAGNHEIIFQSQGYTSKQGCENGIDSVRKNAAEDAAYERKVSSGNDHYFVLKAKNHEIIGRSQIYSSRQSMENGIDSVKRNAPAASVEDLVAQIGSAT